MTVYAWPSGLPQLVLVDSFKFTYPKQVISTQMDVGPPKQRRRSTAAVSPIVARVWLDSAGKILFDEFYLTTLAGGSLPFEWADPLTQITATFRFQAEKPPTLTPVHGTLFVLEMNLDKLP